MKSSVDVDLNIPVYQPFLNGNEKKYINQCVDSGWISSKGSFVSQFENNFAKYINVAHATSVCNGTVALHLALLALNIKPGDEVIVPTLTYVASVNTIVQAGAIPVFVDSLESTWQMDPQHIIKKITKKTKAIMVVHLYGHSCDMALITDICREYSLLLIEDCAEGFGSYFKNQHVGTFGDIATFSFFGNKTITTGEGGMVVSNNKDIYSIAANLKNQSVSSVKQYWHDTLGYNYRMTNICAAIGLAQLEQAEVILKKKRLIADWYRDGLKGLPLIVHRESEQVKHSYWMVSILLDDANNRDLLRNYLDKMKIETRQLFYPVHLFPMYLDNSGSYPIAESIGSRGINLPSWPGLKIEQVELIIKNIHEYFRNFA